MEKATASTADTFLTLLDLFYKMSSNSHAMKRIETFQRFAPEKYQSKIEFNNL